MNEVPKNLQTYNYETPKKKKPSKLKRELESSEKLKIKKSNSAMEKRKKDNSKMKTLTFPGYRK